MEEFFKRRPFFIIYRKFDLFTTCTYNQFMQIKLYSMETSIQTANWNMDMTQMENKELASHFITLPSKIFPATFFLGS